MNKMIGENADIDKVKFQFYSAEHRGLLAKKDFKCGDKIIIIPV